MSGAGFQVLGVIRPRIVCSPFGRKACLVEAGLACSWTLSRLRSACVMRKSDWLGDEPNLRTRTSNRTLVCLEPETRGLRPTEYYVPRPTLHRVAAGVRAWESSGRDSKAVRLTNVAKLASNENPLGPVAAGSGSHEAADGCLNLYPNGGLDLRNVLARAVRPEGGERHGWQRIRGNHFQHHPHFPL